MAQTTSEFMGIDGFIWFVGVVEDRQDPDKLGRVRVRCLGFHTENITDLPTADLPWAHIMHPVTDPSMHGLGNTPAFMVEGSWVIGFFRDAAEKQYPVIIGTLPGIPVQRNIGVGFGDTRDTGVYGPYPSTTGLRHSGHRIGEPDTSKLARGIESEKHLALQRRRERRLIAIPMATRPSMTATVAGDTSERPTFAGAALAIAEANADAEAEAAAVRAATL